MTDQCYRCKEPAIPELWQSPVTGMKVYYCQKCYINSDDQKVKKMKTKKRSKGRWWSNWVKRDPGYHKRCRLLEIPGTCDELAKEWADSNEDENKNRMPVDKYLIGAFTESRYPDDIWYIIERGGANQYMADKHQLTFGYDYMEYEPRQLYLQPV